MIVIKNDNYNNNNNNNNNNKDGNDDYDNDGDCSFHNSALLTEPLMDPQT